MRRIVSMFDYGKVLDYVRLFDYVKIFTRLLKRVSLWDGVLKSKGVSLREGV